MTLPVSEANRNATAQSQPTADKPKKLQVNPKLERIVREFFATKDLHKPIIRFSGERRGANS
jgi:hypothetical protein